MLLRQFPWRKSGWGGIRVKLTENWDKLSPQEKYEERFRILMNPGIEFASPEAEKAYRQRAQMIKDAIELKKPERVPISAFVGFFPAGYAGLTAYDMMYDYEKLGIAFRKFHEDFKTDTLVSSFLIGPGKVFEILDYKLYQWPGHGTPLDAPYQCVEKEYMYDFEYDLLINDPSSYWMRYYLPRTFNAFGPWQALPPWTDLVELPFVGATMIPFGLPHVQESFKKLLEAGQAALEWVGAFSAIDGQNIAVHGVVPVFGGFAKAPFDTLGDTLRGTRHIMLDMFRRPKKLLEAMERLVAINVEMGVRSATANRHPVVFIPLHKGADGFMSNADFAMLKAGSPGEVEEYVRFLMKNVARDGGFILTSGVVIDDAEPENIHAMINAGLKYGVYK
jgi:hypothetical protein